MQKAEKEEKENKKNLNDEVDSEEKENDEELKTKEFEDMRETLQNLSIKDPQYQSLLTSLPPKKRQKFIQMHEMFKKREFWDTQPVPKFSQENEQEQKQNSGGAIENKTLNDVQKNPYPLMELFEWTIIDLDDDKQINEFYELLRDNYVEDDDNMFRFDYSISFLRWALQVPNYYKEWIVGVRVKASQKLVASITGIPVHISIDGTEMKMAEINFLCVQRKIRNHRLAPVLIKEVTRRVNLKKIWQAVYTAGILVPTPISAAQYFHRNLNPQKLLEVLFLKQNLYKICQQTNFTSLRKNQTLARLKKLYKLPIELTIQNIREMNKKDVFKVFNLINEELNVEEVKHYFLPRKDVVFTYVVYNQKDITDLISFYYLPSSILKSPKYQILKAAYSFYFVSKTIPLSELYQNALIIANNNEMDVFNALNIMENQSVFENIYIKELKFNAGDGNLHYYLFNWKLNQKLNSKEIGMVLV